MTRWDWILGGLCGAWTAALVLILRPMVSPSAEWAAWVQAFGSIAAILVAVAVAANQNRENREMARRQMSAAKFERIAPLRALVDFARSIAAEADWRADWIEDKWDLGFWAKINDEIDAVEIMSLADHELAAAFLDFEQAFGALLHAIKVIASRHIDEDEGKGPGVDDEDVGYFEDHYNAVADTGARLAARLVSLEAEGL
jgi:hypothetical protein